MENSFSCLSGLTVQGLALGSGSPPNVPGVPVAVNPYGAPQPQPQPPLPLPLPQTLPQPQPPISQVFGALIPGRPVRTDFVPADASGLKFALNLSCPGDLSHPLSAVREIVFFLLPGIMLPVDHGVLVYLQLAYSGAPASSNNPSIIEPALGGFELLGAITSDQPSWVFQTGWSEKEELTDLSSRSVPVSVTIAASIEPLANLQNLGVANRPYGGGIGGTAESQERRLHVAQAVAYDLFYFMQSFDTGAAGPGNMVVPQNIFDRWFHRFENRFRRDPNFFLKNRRDS